MGGGGGYPNTTTAKKLFSFFLIHSLLEIYGSVLTNFNNISDFYCPFNSKMSLAFMFLMSESIPFSSKISVNLVLLQIELQLVVKEEYVQRIFNLKGIVSRDQYLEIILKFEKFENNMKIYNIEEFFSG
jgi:hypothetical protein